MSKPTIEDIRFLEEYYRIRPVESDKAIIQFDGIIWKPICSYSEWMDTIMTKVAHLELEGFLFVPLAWTPNIPKITDKNGNTEENE